MKNSISFSIIGIFSLFLISCSKPNFGTEKKTFLKRNELVNQSLKQTIDFKDSLAIFRTVFSSLPDEVYVLPTENYYYFELSITGKLIKGNIALFANLRDGGFVNFGYNEVGTFSDPSFDYLSGEMDLTTQHGVVVNKMDIFSYTISFENKTVVFHLNDIGVDGIIHSNLAFNEIFLGTCFDESGMPFDLLFDSLHKHMFYVLNEAEYIPEDWHTLSEDIIIGKRTGFAFYNDRSNNRKVLIGVYAKNENENNWFDGPFDQLPDNMIYAGLLNLKPYIELMYPSTYNKIDQYGNYLDDPYTRVAISSYLSYLSVSDIKRVFDISANTASDLSELIYQLTQPREVRLNANV